MSARKPLPAAPGAPAIELVDATKRYGDQVALDCVSLRIEHGEFFCLLGPAGCGKTTTLNLIGGFVPLTSGVIRIDGRRGMNGNARPPIQQSEVTRKGLVILGSYITNFTFPQAIRLVESGQLRLAPIVTAILPLERTGEGIERIRSGEATKIVIRP